MLPKRWKVFACSHAHGRSSNCSASSWSVTCVQTRSPTPSGICRQLMCDVEDVRSLAAISLPTQPGGCKRRIVNRTELPHVCDLGVYPFSEDRASLRRQGTPIKTDICSSGSL